MASEASATANGIYDTQYGQPAELAASTPSHATKPSQTSAGSVTQQKADPQEIGWYFVEQYYTTLSKTPERIHLFYSKKSQLVTGIEAEKIIPAVGTKAISDKIKALDIQDCKVRVLNVDSQSSFDNIVVQVIGEMSNKSQPHQKFVQTFVLATQPNGYFVLNDIFRYLNDEEDEILEDGLEQPAPVPEQPPQVEQKSEAPVLEEIVNTEEAANAVDTKLESIGQPSVEKPNGFKIELPLPEANETQLTDADTQDSLALPVAEQPPAPEPTPVVEASPQLGSEQPAAAPTKKTWASMVGTKAPAVPALPVTTSTQTKTQRPAQPTNTLNPDSEASTASVATAVTTASSAEKAQASAQADEWQTADHGKKAKASQVRPVEGAVHAYLKNITEKVDARDLRQTLEKYGGLKYFDVARPKNCAFVEFADPAGFAAAVAANPHMVNGESINVEKRLPGTYSNGRGNFNRGASNAGRGRGNVQGRTGSQGNVLRDKNPSLPQRGGKPGNVTPKGRGQNATA